MEKLSKIVKEKFPTFNVRVCSPSHFIIYQEDENDSANSTFGGEISIVLNYWYRLWEINFGTTGSFAIDSKRAEVYKVLGYICDYDNGFYKELIETIETFEKE